MTFICGLSSQGIVCELSCPGVFHSDHFQRHWYHRVPFRRSGYRCLRINHDMDPPIGKAGTVIGLTPVQLSMDRYSVSYRIWEDGSTCVLLRSLHQPKSVTSANISASCCEKLKTRPSFSVGLNIYTVLRFTL